ncbi:hypothetical protein IAR55_001462 [Kwoniella newhampshirensis]|uniref:Uncharacterized protein n=1 Tax=Kwoniella newhampshirensis TaxID=1651941 RepID=A0AAW0Z276_9TREE
MPVITNSPMSSPSLRTIAHAQMHNSYFPSVPTVIRHHNHNNTHHPVPRTPQSSLNVISIRPSPHDSHLVGCLKHTSGIVSSSPISEYPAHQDRDYVHPTMRSVNLQEKRRASMGIFKVSQIPLGPSNPSIKRSMGTAGTKGTYTSESTDQDRPVNSAVGRTQTMDNGARRRPSFKIELPARPSLGGGGNQQILSDAFVESPSIQQQHEDERNTQPSWFTSGRINDTPSGPVLKDPFQSQTKHSQTAGGYIILRAPSHFPEHEHGNARKEGRPHSPSHQSAEKVWPGMVGLGYSLNRLRAPTPWLRDVRGGAEEEDGEWLRGEDLGSVSREVEGRMKGLGFE